MQLLSPPSRSPQLRGGDPAAANLKGIAVFLVGFPKPVLNFSKHHILPGILCSHV